MFGYRANLTEDVEIIEGENAGRAYVLAKFRVAVNDRYRDHTGAWKDADPLFWACEAWGATARGLRGWKKGAPILVLGELAQKQYAAEDGSKRTKTYFKVSYAGRPAWEKDEPAKVPAKAADEVVVPHDAGDADGMWD